MPILTEDMKRVVREQRLGFYATVCEDGSPNLSPKGTTGCGDPTVDDLHLWDDDHLFFCDIRSPQTVANLRANPAIEVNVVDVLSRKGWRFKGTAHIHAGDEIFERGTELLRTRGYDTSRVNAVVLIHVERALPLTSPVYDSGATEDEVRRATLNRLGLREDLVERDRPLGDLPP